MRINWTRDMGWLAGLVTWLAVGLPIFADLLAHPLQISPWTGLGLVAYLLFGVFFLLIVSELLEPIYQRYPSQILLMQVVLASIAFLVNPRYELAAILFIITAAHAANIWPWRWSAALVLLQSAVVAAGIFSQGPSFLSGIVDTLIYSGFQFFALVSSEIAVREMRARTQLAKLNAELKATQVLLAESSKMGERVRIARELHDLIGHQLTALSLNLEVAAHTEGQKSKTHVGKAQKIAKDLLSDVRGVVSTMREGSVNLEAALCALVEGVPRPAIHLSLAFGLAVEEPQKAQALVRCVQEIITNTVRHAGANNLWITIETTASGIVIHARDDGRGHKDLRYGNGLSGMRERLEGFGGQLSIRSRPGEGFALDAVLPV
ncbi:MAG: sensor histidine kinase [Thermaceae bacterium]|nr:sensor histidine kinase [Thermaceae bacterium]